MRDTIKKDRALIFDKLDSKKHSYTVMIIVDDKHKIRSSIINYITTSIASYGGSFKTHGNGKLYEMEQNSKKIIGVIGNSETFEFTISSGAIEDLCDRIEYLIDREKQLHKAYLYDEGEVE